jgi:hypothetical protein
MFVEVPMGEIDRVSMPMDVNYRRVCARGASLALVLAGVGCEDEGGKPGLMMQDGEDVPERRF